MTSGIYFAAAAFGRVVASDVDPKPAPPRQTGLSQLLRRPEGLIPLTQEQLFPEKEVPVTSQGTYIVPRDEKRWGCIGLNWIRKRRFRELVLHFAVDTPMPDAGEARVQYWEGLSPLQGRWTSMDGAISTQHRSWVFSSCPLIPSLKIRWIFPTGEKPTEVFAITAFTASRWKEGSFNLQMLPPRSGNAQIRILNGSFLEKNRVSREEEWDLSQAFSLKVRYAYGSQRSDETLLSFVMPSRKGESLPTHTFAVKISDVVQDGSVAIWGHNVLISRADAPLNVTQIHQALGSERLLDKVRKMPDQTFSAALDKVHDPLSNEGPTMLSLANDNHKFVVDRDGRVTRLADTMIAPYLEWKPKSAWVRPMFTLTPSFGEIEPKEIHRELEDGWLPISVNYATENDVEYRQRTFVVPLHEKALLPRRALGVIETTIWNTSAEDRPASWRLKGQIAGPEQTFAFGSAQWLAAEFRVVGMPPTAWQTAGAGRAIWKGNRLIAYAPMSKDSALDVEKEGSALIYRATLPAKARQRILVLLPTWGPTPEELESLEESEPLRERVKPYWTTILAGSTEITIPDRFLSNLIRASQLHSLLATRNLEEGKLLVPWVSAVRFGPLDSEANPMIRGMAGLGHAEYSRRSFDYFISTYTPESFMTTGYTLVGTGWHLWALGTYYQLSRDRDWLGSVAPKVSKACQWIVEQIKKTRRKGASGEKLPEFGLFPPGVTADWNLFAYRFMMEALYWAGLQSAAEALEDIEDPNARDLLNEAAQFRKDILAAFQWAQSHTPVQRLAKGIWAQPYPTSLFSVAPGGRTLPWGRFRPKLGV